MNEDVISNIDVKLMPACHSRENDVKLKINNMPRIIKSGLIQMSLPKTEGEGTIRGNCRSHGAKTYSVD